MNNQPTAQKRQGKRRFGLILLSLCLLLGIGCRIVEETARLPGKTVAAVVPGTQPSQPDPAVIQAELLRYADDFTGRTAVGLDQYAVRVNTPEARMDALNWKIAVHSSVLGIVTGANPSANLVDILALSSLIRAFLEQNATNAVTRHALDPWLENSRVLETNAWKIAEKVLTTEQQREFRTAIARWLDQNSLTGAGFFRRPEVLASGIRQSGEGRGQPGSVFNLARLDPTLGLDPAVREITHSRLFAERALFALERMPFLLRWQAELFTEQFLQRQQLTNALASADRLSRAAESASRTVESLPERVTAERKAILEALETQEGKLRSLSAEVGRTLDAGDKMSTSLNTTITTFDALMKRFGVGEPDSSPPDTNSPPFNILDYATAAEKIAMMAQQVDALIKDTTGTLDAPALDKRIADLNSIATRAKADAKSVLNHAFLLAAGLILLCFACALLYRRLVTRRSAATGASSAELQ